jgi:predicted amidohydrolase
MKVAAYQTPLLPAGSPEAIKLVSEQVRRCESEAVSILCCPEAILGGLADYSENPLTFAIRTEDGRLNEVLAPLVSNTVTSIIGFTELADDNQLYNAAAVFHRGGVIGVYRKRHPAIRRSVYSPGSEAPVFRVSELTFGIVICYDSTFSEPARAMASQGATALFIPTNNGLPDTGACADLVHQAKASDLARAVENRVWVIRADVAGATGELISHGSSEIIDPNGRVIKEAQRHRTDLLVVNIAGVNGSRQNSTPNRPF